MKSRSNIILVGMPGSGKSTVGVILAKELRLAFLDTDVLIQTAEARSLQDIVDRDGYLALRRVEEEVLTKLACSGHVIATGGSAVYSPAAMDHLKKNGIVVFLQVDLETITSRVRDFGRRGLAKRPDQSLDDLFQERSGLYRKYADVIVDGRGSTHEGVCARIITALKGPPDSGLTGCREGDSF